LNNKNIYQSENTNNNVNDATISNKNNIEFPKDKTMDYKFA